MPTLFRKKILITVVLAVTWTAALALGARVLFRYETTPGRVGMVSSSWPVESIVPRPAGKPSLLMLAHPHCPCTRASIAELAEIMAHGVGKVNAYVLFVKPAGSDADWDDTDLRRSAAAIPGVTVITDEQGMEAARFGGKTSGHTLIFDATGKLLFSGGITASRGHIGNNAGKTAVLAAVKQQPLARTQTPVFGCALEKRNSLEDG
ncbi:MAG TPA: hypothetical protein VJS88_05550, partial [Chthoniobacterales bacterium]|nr:hypothetical protein [Chthoniobacterales bacterium]